MTLRNLFSSAGGGKISEKKIGGSPGNSEATKEFLNNPNVSEALDRSSEISEFHELIKNKGEGGLTKQEMKEIFGGLMAGKGRTISRKEAYAIAKEVFGDEKVRYIMPRDKTRSLGGFRGKNGMESMSGTVSSGRLYSKDIEGQRTASITGQSADREKASVIPLRVGNLPTSDSQDDKKNDSTASITGQSTDNENEDVLSGMHFARKKKGRDSFIPLRVGNLPTPESQSEKKDDSDEGGFFKAMLSTLQNRGK